MIDTLRRFLSAHFPEPGDFDTASSGSTIEGPPFDARVDSAFPSGEAGQAPTDETIRFCKVISSLEASPDLFPLLAGSAGAIHPQFAADLVAHFPRPGTHRSEMHSLASYGNALGHLTFHSFLRLRKHF